MGATVLLLLLCILITFCRRKGDESVRLVTPGDGKLGAGPPETLKLVLPSPKKKRAGAPGPPIKEKHRAVNVSEGIPEEREEKVSDDEEKGER